MALGVYTGVMTNTATHPAYFATIDNTVYMAEKHAGEWEVWTCPSHKNTMTKVEADPTSIAVAVLAIVANHDKRVRV